MTQLETKIKCDRLITNPYFNYFVLDLAIKKYLYILVSNWVIFTNNYIILISCAKIVYKGDTFYHLM